MSTTSAGDEQLIEKTRAQLRGLLAEIAQLARQQSAPEDFYEQFLRCVIAGLAAEGGAVWRRDAEGNPTLAAEVRLVEAGFSRNPAEHAGHAGLLRQRLSASDGMVVSPAGSAAASQANPSEHLLVLAPLKAGNRTVGVVEIFQRGDAPPASQRGYLTFLLQACETAAPFLDGLAAAESREREALWGRLEAFTRAVHAGLDVRQTAFAVANEGRALAECDRVSVALCRGRKCRVEAISGQDVFDPRSNPVRLMNCLAEAVVATGEPLWYEGNAEELPPQIERAVESYADESQSKLVAVLPLSPPTDDEEHPASRRQPPLGALLVEQIEDTRSAAALRGRVEPLREHAALALANSLAHQNLFLMPLWKLLGRASVVVRARHLPKTLIALALLVGLVAALVLVPADFDLEARGTLQPVLRGEVFAPIGGTVGEVLVEHGAPVDEGTPLARMRNVDMDLARTDLDGRWKATFEELTAAAVMLHDRSLSTAEREQWSGKKRELEATLSSLERQIDLLEEKRKLLTIGSPLAGEVITMDVRNRLILRPVQPGQALMSVANPKGPWELLVYMPEDRMGHVAEAQAELGEELPVTFILATDPGVKYHGVIKEVQHRAEVRGEHGNTVLIKVRIDKSQLGPIRPGADVIAKVHCGRRALGYTWLHDAIDFVRSRILFRF